MEKENRKTVLLEELVVAAFDTAAKYSTDPREISRLAIQTISRLLQRAQKISHKAILLVPVAEGNL